MLSLYCHPVVQRVTILASSVSRISLSSRACGVSTRCDAKHTSQPVDAGGSSNWFTKMAQMADGSEVADILQDIEESTRQNAADEVRQQTCHGHNPVSCVDRRRSSASCTEACLWAPKQAALVLMQNPLLQHQL